MAQHAFQQLDRTLVIFVQGLISISIFFVILLVPRSNPMWKKPSASWFDAASKALCVWPLDGRPAYLGAVDSWEATKRTNSLESCTVHDLSECIEYIRVFSPSTPEFQGFLKFELYPRWWTPGRMKHLFFCYNLYQRRFGKQITSFPKLR